MIRFKRDFRLIPLVLVATVSLFALKVSGLVFDGGYTLGERLAGANKSDLTPTTKDTIPEVTPIIFAGGRTPTSGARSTSRWTPTADCLCCERITAPTTGSLRRTRRSANWNSGSSNACSELRWR